MTANDHAAIIARYRAENGKATPTEYMAYMWSRQALRERLSAGLRGFLAAAQKPHWHGEPLQVAVSEMPLKPPPETDDVPAWAIEDAQ